MVLERKPFVIDTSDKVPVPAAMVNGGGVAQPKPKKRAMKKKAAAKPKPAAAPTPPPVEEPLQNLASRVPRSLAQKVKMAALLNNNQSVQAWVTEAVREKLARDHKK